MEHYPEIDRRDGTLFFIPNGDRAAIAISIERLIDLLDAAEGDPDFEANGDERDQSYTDGRDVGAHQLEDDEADTDDEPSLGAEERHPHIWCSSHEGDQTRWAYNVGDDREDDGDDLEPGVDEEYSNGWTGHIDQTKAMAGNPQADDGEGEPDMGWCGHGTGLHPTEPVDAYEANGDELDENGDEQDCCRSEDEWHPLAPGMQFDGSGQELAYELINGLPVADLSRPIVFIDKDAAMDMTAEELGAALVEMGFAKARRCNQRGVA